MPRIAELTFLFSHQSKVLRYSLGVALALLCNACVTTEARPNVDLVLAREAFNSANEVEAAKYSPAYYHKAEETFRHAMLEYNAQAYDEAIADFKLARAYSERAENTSRVQRQKAGEEGL